MIEHMTLGFRKFKGKFVAYKLIVAKKTINIFGHTHRTENWLLWSDYEQIFEQFDSIIAEDSVKHCGGSKKTRPDPKWQRPVIRQVPDSCIKIDVSVEKREAEVLKLLQIEERQAYDVQFLVKVANSLSTDGDGRSDLATAESSSENGPSNEVYTPESSPPSYKPRAKTNEGRHKDMQEYVPKSSTSSSMPQSPYVPSKIVVSPTTSSDPMVLDQQYSPKPVPEAITIESSQNSDSDDDVINRRRVKYTPTPRKSSRRAVRKINSDELVDENGLLVIEPMSRKRQANAVVTGSDDGTSGSKEGGQKHKKTRHQHSSPDSLCSSGKSVKNLLHDSNKSLFGEETDSSGDERAKKKPDSAKNLFEKYKIDMDDLDGEAEPKTTAKPGSSKPSKRKEKENAGDGKRHRTLDNWFGKPLAGKDDEVVTQPPAPASKKAGTSKPSKPPKDKLPKMYKHPKIKKPDLEAIKKLEKERALMARTRQQLDDLNSGFNATQEEVELLTLKDLGLDIVDKFDALEERLTSLLEEYKDVTNFKKVKVFDALTPGDILSTCSLDQTYEISKFLNRHYNPTKENLGRYESCFTEILVPEWIVGVFMEKYGKTREEALDHMYRQRNLLGSEDFVTTLDI